MTKKKAKVSTGNTPLDINTVATFNEAITDFTTRYKPVEYTIVFAHSHLYEDQPRHALCVRKKDGSLHAGRWNLPGGKILEGEPPYAGALRELKEETGCEGTVPQRIGAILPGVMDWNSVAPFIVHIVRVMLAPQQTLSFPAEQPADWKLIKDAGNYRHNFVPNLATILPLCAAGMMGFIIQDNIWKETKSVTSVTFLPHDIVSASPPRRKASFTA